MKLDASDPFVLVNGLAEESRVDQNPKPVSSPETAKTIMKIGLFTGIVIILVGAFLLLLNLTGNATPSFVNARGGYSGLVQGVVLMIVGLVITVFLVIGLTGKPDEESSGINQQRGP